MPDGTRWNGKNLLKLVHSGNSPFRNVWDVKLLLREVETQTQSRIVDIPMVYGGANNYVCGFFTTSPNSNSSFYTITIEY